MEQSFPDFYFLLPIETWRIQSLEDFAADHPRYGEEFFATVRRMYTSNINRDAGEDVNLILDYLLEQETSRQLLALAYLILQTFEIPPEEVAEPVRRLLIATKWEVER